MTELPRFSIVTISFNQAAFLERCILSVLQQNGVEVEYIVIDAGSSDGSRDIIERYRDRIQTVIFESDDGPADGLNKGLARATGEYFGYINSDDELVPDSLARAARAFAEDTGLTVVYGNGVIADRDGAVTRHAFAPRLFTPDLYVRGLAMLIQQATFTRTAALKAVGGFNTANRTCWDGEAMLDIALAGGRFKRIWETWGLFRIYDESISGSGRLLEAYRIDVARMFRKVKARAPGPADRLMTRLLFVATRASDTRRLRQEIVHSLRPGREHS